MDVHLTRSAIAAAALLLASCGPRTLELPQEPVDRAATCGAVTAAAERGAAGVGAPLPLEAVGRIIHYPLLGGAAGEGFSSDAAAAVQRRMSELQDQVAEGNWQDLIPVCRAAFPATAVDAVKLPSDRFEAQLGCDELGDFLRSAIDEQEEYENEIGQYRQLSTRLEASVAAGLRSRAGADAAAQRAERRKALAAMAKAGAPVAVMRQCLERFS